MEKDVSVKKIYATLICNLVFRVIEKYDIWKSINMKFWNKYSRAIIIIYYTAF